MITGNTILLSLTRHQPGDRIEVIADKRKWVYEIYAGEEGRRLGIMMRI